MTPKPHASVLMLAYNHGPYIRRAVESVLSQKTNFPFEVVIGEDCSTDGTREIVLEYEHRYPDVVRVVTSAKNVGMHQNVVRTQQACRGEFLAFCEGDDFWHDSNKLQTQVEFMTRNPDYGLTHCNYDAYDVTEDTLRRGFISCHWPLRDDDGYRELLLRERRIMTLTVCVRRDLLEKVVKEQPECTDENWPMGDTQRWLEICRLAKVKYFPQSMATYNFLPESASQSRNLAKTLRFTEKAGQLILHYLEKYPIGVGLDHKVRRRVVLEVMAMAYSAGDREKTLQWATRLREIGQRVPFDAILYELGAKGKLGKLAAQPAIWLLGNLRTAQEKLIRFYCDKRTGQRMQSRGAVLETS